MLGESPCVCPYRYNYRKVRKVSIIIYILSIVYTRYPRVILYQIYIIIYRYLHSTHPCGITIIWNTNHCSDDTTTVALVGRAERTKITCKVYVLYINTNRCYNNNNTIIIIIITFQQCHYVIRTRYRRYFWTDTMCGSPPTVYFGEGACPGKVIAGYRYNRMCEFTLL